MTHLRRYLDEHGVLYPEQLAEAIRRQQIYGGSLDTVLLELELVDPITLGEMLERACGFPIAPPDLLENGIDRPWTDIPEDLQRSRWVEPLVRDGNEIVVAVHPDLPNDLLGRLLRSLRRMRPMVTPECCLEKVAAERHRSVVPQRYAVLCAAYLSAVRRRPSMSGVFEVQDDEPPSVLQAAASPPPPRLVTEPAFPAVDLGAPPPRLVTEPALPAVELAAPPRRLVTEVALPAVDLGTPPPRLVTEPALPAIDLGATPVVATSSASSRTVTAPGVPVVEKTVATFTPPPVRFPPGQVHASTGSAQPRASEVAPSEEPPVDRRSAAGSIHVVETMPMSLPGSEPAKAVPPPPVVPPRRDEADVRRRLEQARAVLEASRSRDEALEAIAAAAMVISSRVGLFRARGEELVGLTTPRSAIDDVGGKIVAATEGSAAGIAATRGAYSGLAPDADLRLATGASPTTPCLLQRVDVRGKPIVFVYLDRDGASIEAQDVEWLGDLAALAGRVFEEILKLRRQPTSPSPAATPPPTVDAAETLGRSPGAGWGPVPPRVQAAYGDRNAGGEPIEPPQVEPPPSRVSTPALEHPDGRVPPPALVPPQISPPEPAPWRMSPELAARAIERRAEGRRAVLEDEPGVAALRLSGPAVDQGAEPEPPDVPEQPEPSKPPEPQREVPEPPKPPEPQPDVPAQPEPGPEVPEPTPQPVAPDMPETEVPEPEPQPAAPEPPAEPSIPAPQPETPPPPDLPEIPQLRAEADDLDDSFDLTKTRRFQADASELGMPATFEARAPKLGTPEIPEPPTPGTPGEPKPEIPEPRPPDVPEIPEPPTPDVPEIPEPPPGPQPEIPEHPPEPRPEIPEPDPPHGSSSGSDEPLRESDAVTVVDLSSADLAEARLSAEDSTLHGVRPEDSTETGLLPRSLVDDDAMQRPTVGLPPRSAGEDPSQRPTVELPVLHEDGIPPVLTRETQELVSGATASREPKPERPRSLSKSTMHSSPPPPPLPPPPASAVDDEDEPGTGHRRPRSATIHGLPPPELKTRTGAVKRMGPPSDELILRGPEDEEVTIISLAEPIMPATARGRIELEDEDWVAPGSQLASDSQQGLIDAVIDAVVAGEADVETLRGHGDTAMLRLVAQFPGPLEVLRRDLRALPPPSAHGPLVRTVIAVGAPVVPYLIDLYEHPNPDVRFYAAFVFHELRDARCMRPLAKLAFDANGDVRVVSMRVLETYRRSEGFEVAASIVRTQLVSDSRPQQLHAARASGTLRDIGAIPQLVDLLASSDRFIQEAALESLCSITGQQHGLKPHRWRAWYEEQGHRHRVEWIIDSLRHRDLPVRRWAADELVRITGHRVPFSPMGDKRAREVAAKAWTDWWEARGREMFGG